MRPKPEQYLIQTTVGKAVRQIVWSSTDDLDLDVPKSWRISKTDDAIIIRDTSVGSSGDIFQVAEIQEGQQRKFVLPNAREGHGAKRRVAVEIVKLRAPRPVYVNPPRPASLTAQGPRQLCAFYGQRYFLIRYRPIAHDRAVGLGNLNAFEYKKIGSGYMFTSRHEGVRISIGGRKIMCEVGKTVSLTDVDFYRATVMLGIHWWRFRMVPTPDGQPPLVTDETEDDLREKLRLHYSTVALLSLTAVLLLSAWVLTKVFPPPPKVIHAEVAIKVPKVMPAFEEPKKPEPPKIVEVEKPKPKPEAKKPEPPKKVAKVEPKKPTPKVARKAEPTRKIVKAEPPPPPKASRVVPPPEVKKVEQGPTPEQLVAQQKAQEQAAQQTQLLKSLSFLSTNKSAAGGPPAKYESKTGKFAAAQNVGGVVSKSNTLDKITKGVPGDGSIQTKSGRGIASSVKFDRNKGLNDVEGKVSEGELFSKNGNPGDALGGGKGLELSGPGELSESQIEKALSKFLSRFQYCYEKALLSDSSLSGNVMVQWTVTTAGRASDSRITKSQLNNAELHGCLLKILAEVPFPKPKGGSVTVKKSFAFSSSSI